MITRDEPLTHTDGPFAGRVNLGYCSDTEVCDAVLAADKARSQAEAELLRALGEFDARNLHKDDGALTAKTWLTNNCDLSSSDAGPLAALARKLRRHPSSMAACFDIGTGRVREFLSRVNSRTEDTFTDMEEGVLGTIADFTVDDVTRFATTWRAMMDQDGAKPPEEKPALSFGITGNGLFGRFALFGEQAAAFFSMINAESDAIYRSEGDDHLPAGERRSQAMMNIMGKGAATDKHCTDPLRPTVIIHITLKELLAKNHRTAQADPGGQVIGEHELRRMMCDADLHRLITDPRGAVINFGRTQRVVSANMRLALIACDRHCQFPGCERPPSMCHAHHVKHWEDGGPTDLTNMTLLCSAHHHKVHEERFGCEHGPDGTIVFSRPDGTPLHHKPRPG